MTETPKLLIPLLDDATMSPAVAWAKAFNNTEKGLLGESTLALVNGVDCIVTDVQSRAQIITAGGAITADNTVILPGGADHVRPHIFRNTTGYEVMVKTDAVGSVGHAVPPNSNAFIYNNGTDIEFFSASDSLDTTAVKAIISSYLTAGSNVIISEVGGNLVIASSGGGGGGGGTVANLIDVPPLVPNALNEEMEGPLDAAWVKHVYTGTTVAEGTVDMFGATLAGTQANWNVNDQIPGSLILQPPTTGTQRYLNFWRPFNPAPGEPFVVAVKAHLGASHNNDEAFSMQLRINTEADGEFVNFNNTFLGITQYGDIGGDTYHAARAYSFNGGGLNTNSHIRNIDTNGVYLAYVGRADNSLEAWFSPDGLAWRKIVNYGIMGLGGNIHYIAFGLYNNGPTGEVSDYAIIDWIRFIEGDANLLHLSGALGG